MASLNDFNGAPKHATDIITSPTWVQSVNSESTGEYADLLSAARYAYRQSEYLPWRHSFGIEEDATFDELDWAEYDEDQQERFEEYSDEIRLQLEESRLFRESDSYAKVKMLRALRGDFHWVYDTQEMHDGFFEGRAAKHIVKPDILSRYVLSGLLGEQIIRDDIKTSATLERFEGISLYDRAVLVGGAALSATTGAARVMESGGTYLGVKQGRMQFETWTGGDPNGDFRTERIQRPLYSVTTTLDASREHAFMPVVGKVEKASMYHSAEPNLVRALLTHAVLRAGYSAEEFHSEIIAKLKAESIRYGGNFGDYDQSDGSHQASNLRMYLDKPELISENQTLLRSIVMPGLEYQMTLSSTEAGVQFENADEEGTRYSSMFIPNEEIANYVATLVRGGGGRSGPRSMLAVINALMPEDAV